MITIGYSTRKSNTYFSDLVKATCGFKDVKVIEKINNGEKSLSKTYNEILEESETDIVILCHDDILFEKPYWGKRVLEHFEKPENYGILGVAGTRFLPSSGRWWDIQGEMVGQVYHQHEGKKWLSEYNKSFGSKIIETVLVDGLFLAINKKRIKTNFDESFDGFHFYDVSFCFSNFLKGVKIGTISNVPITHLSIGMTNQKWEDNRVKFSTTYSNELSSIIPSTYPELPINKKLPLVSIITPIYNYGVMFEKTLNSIFESTYKNLEIIIVCDGSRDNYVLSKLKTLESHPNIKIIYQENLGPSSARNNGIKNSTGEFILPLDSDDMIYPEYIQSCLNVIKTNKNISPVYCDTHHIGQTQGIEQRPEWSLERLRQGPFIVNCSMFRRVAFDICEGYDTSLFGWEDYDLWIRMGLNGFAGKRISKPLFIYFHHEKDGTVSTEANKNQQELYNKIINKNFKNETVN
jgi:glycosyltransferase involved in cell wall biosynthesis